MEYVHSVSGDFWLPWNVLFFFFFKVHFFHVQLSLTGGLKL